MEPYPTGGYLTTTRELNSGTRLCEIWVLEHLVWDDPDGVYDVIKCYVAHSNDIPHHGIPHQEESVISSCSWDETPIEVREQFESQIDDLMRSVDHLNDRMEESDDG